VKRKKKTSKSNKKNCKFATQKKEKFKELEGSQQHHIF
jgi:hypothetical protein